MSVCAQIPSAHINACHTSTQKAEERAPRWRKPVRWSSHFSELWIHLRDPAWTDKAKSHQGRLPMSASDVSMHLHTWTHTDALMCRHEYTHMYIPYTYRFTCKEYKSLLSKLKNLVWKSSFKCDAVFNLDNAAQPLGRVRSICVLQLLKHTKISRCFSFGNTENS